MQQDVGGCVCMCVYVGVCVCVCVCAGMGAKCRDPRVHPPPSCNIMDMTHLLTYAPRVIQLSAELGTCGYFELLYN